MEIKIGADELILWLRKNGKATQCDNRTIGRRIANLMEKLGGRFGDSDAPALWVLPNSDTSLPRTSQQYIIDVDQLPELFRSLSEM
ncbi:MAG: hypothetical protein HDR37_09175 [Treponema sp.]|nr:hypothetical protein [Treponema sp.]